MADSKNGSITKSELLEALKPIHVGLGQLEKVVKMNISEQRRINNGFENELSEHEKKNREDVQMLWNGIKKNTDRISVVNIKVAYLMGGVAIIAGGSVITKLMGLW